MEKTCESCAFEWLDPDQYPCCDCCHNFVDMYKPISCDKCIHRKVCVHMAHAPNDVKVEKCKDFYPEEGLYGKEDE